jgi:hypothetical protein
MHTSRLKDSYRGVKDIWGVYWKAYGRIMAVIVSPYFHAAILCSLIIFPFWTGKEVGAWFDLCISFMPNSLGFTVAGYAILLAFGDSAFRQLLAGTKDSNGGVSAFIEVNSTFVHFIILQVLALVIALIGKAWCLKSGIFAFIGVVVFIYAITLILAATMAILRLSKWYDEMLRIDSEDEDKPGPVGDKQ